MTVQAAGYFTLQQLKKVFDEGEAAAIAELLMEKLTGSSKVERMLYKQEELALSEEKLLHDWLSRLQQHEPVQYILQEAWFGKLKFFVDQRVLIPRPETEELVAWIAADHKMSNSNTGIIDIGTGSGCIAVSLAKKLPLAKIIACDVSEGALEVAGINAALHNVSLTLLHCDVLAEENLPLSRADVLVSNPPYIPLSEKSTMPTNVTSFEPGSALFVEDNDPLIFYRALVRIAKTFLKRDGHLYCEIHESMGEQVCNLFASENFAVTLRKDMQDKDRMIKATPLPIA